MPENGLEYQGLIVLVLCACSQAGSNWQSIEMMVIITVIH
jgi:hypothetical protein